MQTVDWAALQATAVRLARSTEATLATEEAVIRAEIEFAVENKQAVTGTYWKAAHVARLRAQAARALADALADGCAP